MYIKVENQKNLVRDTNNNAILETDIVAITKHRRSRAILQEKDQAIKELASRLEKLEQFILNDNRSNN